MGSMSVWHWLILIVVGMLAFGGKGKISSIMGDVAEGIKSFKKGMTDDADEAKSGGRSKTDRRAKRHSQRVNQHYQRQSRVSRGRSDVIGDDAGGAAASLRPAR